MLLLFCSVLFPQRQRSAAWIWLDLTAEPTATPSAAQIACVRGGGGRAREGRIDLPCWSPFGDRHEYFMTGRRCFIGIMQMWICAVLSGTQKDREPRSAALSSSQGAHQEEKPPKGKGASSAHICSAGPAYEEPQVVPAAPAQTCHPLPGSNIPAEKAARWPHLGRSRGTALSVPSTSPVP